MGIGKGHWAKLGPESLAFFGHIASGVCHEIKNNLAILNEQTGLIDDLFMMQKQGQTLDMAQMKGITQGMRRQVVRADQVIGRLSLFAHSLDEPVHQVELNQVLSLVEALSQRLASQKQVHLKNEFSSGRAQVRSMPFFLAQVIFICFERAMEAVGSGGRVAVKSESEERGAKIIFFCDPLITLCLPDTKNGHFSQLLQVLGAEITREIESGRFVLHIPKASP